jgi:hypothetical protein
MPLLQRKCACGGGCPRCKEELGIQTKLKISEPGDKYEQEADRIADEVMRMPEPSVLRQVEPEEEEEEMVQRRAISHPITPLVQRQADLSEEEGEEEEAVIQRKENSNSESPVSQNSDIAEVPSIIHEVLNSPGQPLDPATRAFMEPRFGHDFNNVRIYIDSKAATLATALQASAFTLGQHIVFNRGMFSPSTRTGRHILAHELTHVVQQRGSTENQIATARRNSPLSVQQSTAMPIIARLSAKDCASDCEKEDGKGVPTGKFWITLYADKEGAFLLLPATEKVGHSWLRLEDEQGRYWTYGFWPQDGYNSSNIRADVEGCVHHPDTIHKPTASQRFELTAAKFSAAFTTAVDTCKKRPKYNLFGLQCTEFVKQVLAATGEGSFGGFGLIWESPNALHSWIRTHSLVLGTSVTAATSAPDNAGAGSFGLDLTYRYQFYSLLGQKLRLYGLGRAEISGPIKSLTAGTGLELNPKKVWLPAPFVEGGGILGDLSPAPKTSRFGAGLTGAAGVRFNIDEVGVVGIEASLVKDFVNKDPALQRLMFTAGIKF